jgi:hypothetical protein
MRSFQCGGGACRLARLGALGLQPSLVGSALIRANEQTKARLRVTQIGGRWFVSGCTRPWLDISRTTRSA